MADLSLDLRREAQNPIIAASGTFGLAAVRRLYDIGQLGGISVKGLSLLPRTATRPPHRGNAERHAQQRRPAKPRRGELH
ncbi:MAG: hypothetical protein ACLUI3_13785 [Christensenellales bacterium]